MRKVVFGTFSVLLTLAVLSTPILAERTRGEVEKFDPQSGRPGLLLTRDGELVPFVASEISASCHGTLHPGDQVEFDIAVVKDSRGVERKIAKNIACH